MSEQDTDDSTALLYKSRKNDDSSDDEYDEIGTNEDANWDSDDENNPKKKRRFSKRHIVTRSRVIEFAIDENDDSASDYQEPPIIQELLQETDLKEIIPVQDTTITIITTTTTTSSHSETQEQIQVELNLHSDVLDGEIEREKIQEEEEKIERRPPSGPIEIIQLTDNDNQINTNIEEVVPQLVITQEITETDTNKEMEHPPKELEVPNKETEELPNNDLDESRNKDVLTLPLSINENDEINTDNTNTDVGHAQIKDLDKDIVPETGSISPPQFTISPPLEHRETDHTKTEVSSPTLGTPEKKKKKKEKELKKKKTFDLSSSAKGSPSLSPTPFPSLSSCVSEPALSTSILNSPSNQKSGRRNATNSARPASPMKLASFSLRKKKEKRDSKLFGFLPPIMLKTGWVRQSGGHVNKDDFVSHRSSLYNTSSKNSKDSLGNIHDIPDIDMDQVDTKLIPTNQELLLPEDESLDPHTRNKNKVINELIITERDYIFDLLLMLKLFYQPLEKQKILKSSELTSVFGNLPLLLNVNKELLINLQKQIAQPFCPRIGSAFIQMSAYLKMYSVYCNNHQASLDLVVSFCKNNPAFNAFYQDRLTDPYCRNLPLSAFLIKPVQRICKYPLFLKELLKHTKEEELDYPDLLEASNQLEETVAIINESKRRQENQNKILQIQNRLDSGKKLGLLSPSRRFCLEGTFEEVDKETQQVQEKAYYFLFNDLLVRALRQKPLWNPLKKKLDFELLRPTHVLDFTAPNFELQFINHEDSPTLKNAFELKGLSDRIILGNSALETQVWMQNIQECLRQKNGPNVGTRPFETTTTTTSTLSPRNRFNTILSVPILPTSSNQNSPTQNPFSKRINSFEHDESSISPHEKQDQEVGFNSTQKVDPKEEEKEKDIEKKEERENENDKDNDKETDKETEKKDEIERENEIKEEVDPKEEEKEIDIEKKEEEREKEKEEEKEEEKEPLEPKTNQTLEENQLEELTTEPQLEQIPAADAEIINKQNDVV